MFDAVSDFTAGKFAAGEIKRLGLETPEAVRLIMAPSVLPDIRGRIEAAGNAIVAGSLKVPVEWTGAEFATPA